MSQQEFSHLRRIAEERGISASDVIRAALIRDGAMPAAS